MDYLDIFKNIPKRDKYFTGSVMSGDREVCTVERNNITWIDIRYAPLYLIRTSDFLGWLRSRSIDLHRTNSRLLRKVLRLATSDEANIVLYANGATITDNYWTKPIGSGLRYCDVVYKYNSLGDLALTGDPNAFLLSLATTPELTNIGSFEKCWKKQNDSWYLYKRGNDNERFSELFTYELGKTLGFKMAEYELAGRFIKSKDFTESATLNFEPAFALVGDNVDYEFNASVFEQLNLNLLKDYLDILFLDAIVLNADRHEFNYGVMRNWETGSVISMAPNFDNNLSLIAQGYARTTERRDLVVKDFITLISNRNYEIPAMNEEMVSDVFNKCQNQFETIFDKEYVINFCMNAYRLIKGVRQNVK